MTGRHAAPREEGRMRQQITLLVAKIRAAAARPDTVHGTTTIGEPAAQTMPDTATLIVFDPKGGSELAAFRDLDETGQQERGDQ
jgi:hypothetical protein